MTARSKSTKLFIWGLGVPEDEAEFNDVYGLDVELLEWVPKPVLAVIFLFPYSSQLEAEKGQEQVSGKEKFTVFFFYQFTYSRVGFLN